MEEKTLNRKRNGRSTVWGLLLIPGIAALLTACGGPKGGLVNITKETYAAKPPGHTLVIGSVEVKNPKEMGLRMPTFGQGKVFSLTRTSPASTGSENLFHHVDRTGEFYVLLEPGDYRISQISSDVSTLTRSGEIVFQTALPFQVPENKVIYIGAIQVEFALSYLGLSNTVQDRKIVVADHYDEAVKKLKEKFPFAAPDVEKRIIKPDQ